MILNHNLVQIYFPPSVPGFVWFSFVVIAVLIYLIRSIKVQRRNKYFLPDLYLDKEIAEKYSKEVESGFVKFIYWFLIIVGFILMIILAIINKQ